MARSKSKKETSKKQIKKTILLISILLMGCSTYQEVLDQEEPEPQVIEKEVIKEETKVECEESIKIEYRDRNITIPCNTTVVNTSCTTEYNYTGREFELIRRLKFLEGQQDKYFNDSECNDELDKIKDDLEDCEDELCKEWNSSWC